MDFLEESNGVSKYPHLGEQFATITLINDTILKVKYSFPEWTKKVNRISKDSLFPINYYLVRDNQNPIISYSVDTILNLLNIYTNHNVKQPFD